MPYSIQHKTHNSLLIKFVKNKQTRLKKRFKFLGILFAFIAISQGVDFGFVLFVSFFIWVIVNTKQKRANFEIEFLRPQDIIIVRESDKIKPRTMTYTLRHLKGLGFSQIPIRSNAYYAPMAKLFFEFDSQISQIGRNTNSPLIQKAKKISEVDGDVLWQVPLQKGGHIIPVSYAAKLMEDVESWLSHSDRYVDQDDKLDLKETTPIIEPIPEAEPESEILRDFRDM